MIKERKNIMNIKQKRDYILHNVSTDTYNGLKIMYASLLAYDDLYNFKQEMSSIISKMEFGLTKLASKLDSHEVKMKAVKAQNGNLNITAVQAKFQGLEVLSNQLNQLEGIKANYEYSLELKKATIEAAKKLYFDVVGTAYQKWVSPNGPVLQAKFAEAEQWAKDNSHLVEPVLEADPNHVPLPENL
jgi:hypothetical protein